MVEGQMYETLYQKHTANLARTNPKFRCPKCNGALFKVYPDKVTPAQWHLECNNPRCDYSKVVTTQELLLLTQK